MAATEGIRIELVEEMPVAGASPSSPSESSASPSGMPGPSEAMPSSASGKPDQQVVKDAAVAAAKEAELPSAGDALKDVVNALEKVGETLEAIAKKQKDKDIVELNKPGDDPSLITRYTGSFGDRNRPFASEDQDAFSMRQNLQAKIGIGGDLARNAQSVFMGPRQDPANTIGQAGDLAAKSLSLLGPQAAIAGTALKQLTDVFTSSMRSLEARSEQLKQYSPELAMADARRQVARIQSDMMLAQRMGTDLARYTDAASKNEILMSELKARVDEIVEKFLTPILEVINGILGWLLGKGDDEEKAVLKPGEVAPGKMQLAPEDEAVIDKQHRLLLGPFLPRLKNHLRVRDPENQNARPPAFNLK